LRNLFFLIFFSSFFSFFGQEIGDSIIFTTKSGKDYRGILEKKDQDGYFFKTSNDRTIYLSKREIKEFQKIKKEILKDDPSIKVIPEITTKENTEKKIVTEDFNNSSKTEYSIKQISVLIGIEDVTIVLNDGRNFKGKIQKIEYPNGFEQVGSKMIWFESDDKNYKFKEHEISKAFKDVNPQKNLTSENQNEFYKLTKEDKGSISYTINGWIGLGSTGGEVNYPVGFLAELKIKNLIGLGVDYCYVGEAVYNSRTWAAFNNTKIYNWSRTQLRINFYYYNYLKSNFYCGFGIGNGSLRNNYSIRICFGGRYNISDQFGIMGEAGIGSSALRAGVYVNL
jgi:small nuclear ribonucleoprotein (snRNP)-like protein